MSKLRPVAIGSAALVAGFFAAVRIVGLLRGGSPLAAVSVVVFGTAVVLVALSGPR